jgi:hypothetical protein
MRDKIKQVNKDTAFYLDLRGELIEIMLSTARGSIKLDTTVKVNTNKRLQEMGKLSRQLLELSK